MKIEQISVNSLLISFADVISKETLTKEPLANSQKSS